MPRVIPLAVVVLLAATAWAADAPVAKVAIVEPAAGQELTGTTSIHVKTDVPEGATAPSIVYAGLGGAPWTELKRNDAGEWTGGTDTGPCRLIVVTDNRRMPVPAETEQVGRLTRQARPATANRVVIVLSLGLPHLPRCDRLRLVELPDAWENARPF